MYEGWKNYETWNVALWINNEYPLYKSALDFMQLNPDQQNPYKAFVVTYGLSDKWTPDKVDWMSDDLDYDALNEMMLELLS